LHQHLPHRATALLAAAVLALAACDDDPTTPNIPTGVETAVVVNSIDLSLSVFPIDSPQVKRSIGIAPAGSPVSLAVRNNVAVVPLGFLSSAAIVDLLTEEVRTVALPENSGATGVDFLSDSLVYVANPNLNTVSPVNILRATAGSEIAVGGFPQAVIATADRVFVLNAELDQTFRPAKAGGVSVIDPSTNEVISTIILTGFNPSAAAFGPDGLLYVVNAGTFGEGDGSLSVIDPNTLQELEHHPGFGEFPGDIAFGATGIAYVSSFGYGIAIWNAAADTFIRPPSDPLIVEGNAISSGLGFDSDVRLYTLVPGDCIAPSVAYRVSSEATETIGVGVCPIDIAFTNVETP
jgi:YVTN family beta-propeller protein